MAKKILIIAPYTNGYLKYVEKHLNKQGHQCRLYYSDIDFHYKNLAHKIENAFVKLLKGSSLRKLNREKIIKQDITESYFDTILCIRGEFLNQKTHQFLKAKTQDYITYLYDGLDRVPRQKEVLKFCDRIFTFEKKDSKKYDFKFITNFIPSINYQSNTYKYLFYYIGSYDNRVPTLKKISQTLKQEELNFKIKINTKKDLSEFKIESFKERIPINKVLDEIKYAKIVLDIQRPEQNGLTFRIFEALGNQKKIITTNSDIVNYDFYNPHNIFVWNPKDDLNLPKSFIDSDFQPISDKIIFKYSVVGWCNTVFNLS